MATTAGGPPAHTLRTATLSASGGSSARADELDALVVEELAHAFEPLAISAPGNRQSCPAFERTGCPGRLPLRRQSFGGEQEHRKDWPALLPPQRLRLSPSDRDSSRTASYLPDRPERGDPVASLKPSGELSGGAAGIALQRAGSPAGRTGGGGQRRRSSGRERGPRES